MTFLQPAMLFALPAALLPVIIHFLNRLRYRSVKWAAVMFLISATRSSTRRAKLRHYLLLLCRSLTILLFLLALCRPNMGGWLGTTLAGAPDTIIVLLDRSASMEAVDTRFQASKRARALSFFAEAGAECPSSRFVLIENVLKTPQDIASAAALADIAMTGATDTAADIPAMLRAALDYIVRNHTGRTEVWIASDLQKNNWRPQSAEWQTLSAQLSALPQDVRIRLLTFSGSAGNNVAISVNDVQRREGADRAYLSLALQLDSLTATHDSFPMAIVLDGTRSQVHVAIENQRLLHHQTLDLEPGRSSGGWGKVEIPADENLSDNSCYFAYGDPVQLRGAILCDDSDVARYVQLATDPAAGQHGRDSILSAPSEAAGLDWPGLAMIAWQSGAPDGASSNLLHDFVSGGGTVICFPPGRRDVEGLFGLKWLGVESADTAKPFLISTWDENQGPLANTDNGMSLPLPELSILRRQLLQEDVSTTEAEDAPWYPVSSYIDGRPFLLQRTVGKGLVFACTSLPREDWSTLGEGYVLVPMIQRILQTGGARLAHATAGICGAWSLPHTDDVWVCEGSRDYRDIRWQAGVYRSGTKRVALNRPPREDSPETLEIDETKDLFADLPVSVLKDPSLQDGERLQSEVWRIFVYLALFGMIIESGLLLGTTIRATPDSTAIPRKGVS